MTDQTEDLTTYVTDPDGKAEGARVIGGAVFHFDSEGRARVPGQIRWAVWEAAKRLGYRVHTRRRAAAPANTAPTGPPEGGDDADTDADAEPSGGS